MFLDSFPNILPFRTVALQCLFLFMAVAIESAVFQRRLQIEPKDSVYFAGALNLLCVVVGWLAFFILFSASLLTGAETLSPVINFIFFDNWSPDTATLIIVSCLVIFFASLAVKELGLFGLRYLLKLDRQKLLKSQPAPEAEAEAEAEPAPERRVFVQATRRRTSRELLIEVTTILEANAWSYSVILVALVLRQAFL